MESGHVLRAAIKLRPATVDSQEGSQVTVRILDVHTGEIMEPIVDYFVPGLLPYAGRVQIAASTSGDGLNHDIDNVQYQYDLVYNPTTLRDDATSPVVVLDDFEMDRAVDATKTRDNSAMVSSMQEPATTSSIWSTSAGPPARRSMDKQTTTTSASRGTTWKQRRAQRSPAAHRTFLTPVTNCCLIRHDNSLPDAHGLGR